MEDQGERSPQTFLVNNFSRHVLKPETTKRNDRNKRNERNSQNETTKTSETTETSKNKWKIKVKKYDLRSCTNYIHVCDIVTSQILAGPVKMNEHKQDEHEDIEK